MTTESFRSYSDDECEEISESIGRTEPYHRPNKHEITRADKRGDTIVNSRYGLAISWPISSQCVIGRESNLTIGKASVFLWPHTPIYYFLSSQTRLGRT
jgi:hypothetical protein